MKPNSNEETNSIEFSKYLISKKIPRPRSLLSFEIKEASKTKSSKLNTPKSTRVYKPNPVINVKEIINGSRSDVPEEKVSSLIRLSDLIVNIENSQKYVAFRNTI